MTNLEKLRMNALLLAKNERELSNDEESELSKLEGWSFEEQKAEGKVRIDAFKAKNVLTNEEKVELKKLEDEQGFKAEKPFVAEEKPFVVKEKPIKKAYPTNVEFPIKG